MADVTTKAMIVLKSRSDVVKLEQLLHTAADLFARDASGPYGEHIRACLTKMSSNVLGRLRRCVTAPDVCMGNSIVMTATPALKPLPGPPGDAETRGLENEIEVLAEAVLGN